MYRSLIKRVIDFFLSLIGFILLFPLFVAITFFLAIANQGKPFFIQKRPGYKGIIFRIIKFKTMNDKKDKKGKLLSDAERLTGVGKFIRKTSLDEIPQLLNVIIGDMSLIGPRPLLTDYMNLYSPYQNRRHEVKPGITGWAQINGRNAITWDKKFELDVWYVDHLSLKTDFIIFLKTIKKVFKREGINAQDAATIEPFRGNANVIVYGAGGHAKVVLETLEKENKYEILYVIDDNISIDKILGYKVKHDYKQEKIYFKNTIIAIGDNKIRKKIAENLTSNFVMTIHPLAIVSKYSKIGSGSQIFAGAVVNPDAEIGEHCIINTGAIIEHDCKLGNYVHISPNATLGGNVIIGDLSHVGIGATIIQNIKIGKNVTVGAGTVIINDIPDNAVVVGVPGKIIKYHE